MLDFTKGWKCDKCGSHNITSFFEVRVPVCPKCGATSTWSDLLGDYLPVAEKYLAAHTGAEAQGKKREI